VPFSPWVEAGKIPDLHLRFVPLPPETGGMCCVRRPSGNWILIDPDLSYAEKRCGLTHELVHLERGTSSRCASMPSCWDEMVVREELIVDREVARRLVPLDDLEAFVAARSDLEAVDAVLVAEHFRVTERIAGIALEQLAAVVAYRQAMWTRSAS
jgi:hypothetical protein